MDSITQALAVILPWLKFWEWPGRIMKLIEQWKSMRAALHRERIAKAELDVALAKQPVSLREIEISEMMHQIRKHLNEAKPGTVPLIEPDPETNREIWNEAMRRIKQEARLK